MSEHEVQDDSLGIASRVLEIKSIPINTEGYYAREDGVVMSKDFRKPQNPDLRVRKSWLRGGYMMIDIQHKAHFVHRLVALAFHGDHVNSAYSVDHINGNALDNRPTNLRWASKKEQAANRRKPSHHPNNSRPMLYTSSDGTRRHFDCYLDVATHFGINILMRPTALYMALKKGSTFKGGVWEYTDKRKPGVEYRDIPPEAIRGAVGYRAGADGSIEIQSTGRAIMGHMNNSGYMEIKIKGTIYRVHRLIAYTFLGPMNGQTIVNHRDGIKMNNAVENLEWCTQSENVKHAYAIGRATSFSTNRAVIGTRHCGNTVTTYISTSAAARAICGDPSAVSKACKSGRVYKGCMWTYVV